MYFFSYIPLGFISLIYGVLLGNYLTTAYHRIPLGKPLNGISSYKGIKPHCSTCEHSLKYYEYFPVFSWIFTRLKCNYCGASTTIAYTALEVSMMIISFIIYLIIGMNLNYVFLTLLTSTIVLNIALYISYRQVYIKSVILIFIAAIIFSIGYLV